MGLIKLQSSDEKVFEVDREVVQSIELIESMIENFGTDLDDKAVILKNVDSTCLAKILEWLSYMKNSMQVTQADIKRFKAKFIKDNQNIIYGLIEAANFLGIEDLIDILCQSVASKFSDKTTIEIREEFRITTT